jgi:hypothetical protein
MYMNLWAGPYIPGCKYIYYTEIYVNARVQCFIRKLDCVGSSNDPLHTRMSSLWL